jgi:hypothetical protein
MQKRAAGNAKMRRREIIIFIFKLDVTSIKRCILVFFSEEKRAQGRRVHEVFRDNGDEWLGLKSCKSVAGIEVRRLT